ncbi:hypothetical protein [Algibacter pacificus]|uniref:hypothetical protein n=1 Tax=Algibacter pacificus TaxID=2599389 RepID=UPI0011C9B1AD|nr:hypothetical protein [Algibacter pacificus]
MKIKYILFFAIGLIVFFFFLFSSNITGNKSDTRVYKTKKADELVKLSMDIDSLKNLTLYDYETKNHLKDLLLEVNPKIIVVFSSNQCSYCIDHVLNSLKKFENIIQNDKLIMIGEFKNKVDYYKFKKINKIKVPFFYTPPLKGFNLPVNELNTPYVILANSSLKPQYIFVPEKEIPKRTDIHFALMAKEITIL